MTKTYKYNSVNGILSGSAQLDKTTGFIKGVNSGAVTILLNVEDAGIYNMEFEYIGEDINRELKIDINGINTGTIYSLPPTNGGQSIDAKTFTVPINLNSKNNTIKFYGINNNYVTSIGPIIVTLISLESVLPNNEFYDISTVSFKNMHLNVVKRIANMMGGPLDGSATLNLDILKEGVYNLSIKYLAGDNNRTMTIDINGINNGKSYCFPKTINWNIGNIKIFTLPILLFKGINNIKLHGDGINYAPYISDIKISLDN
ncbi:hypothetical protein [Clostridium tarantellae]|uniref:Uncharacterized protein n=1 Tax=Clostridium tarantellae TaxID=39493 RepID=A0A6I1MRA1_9CLOT|nr:hypothetical protein [Clostridium tarantellae]MPQ44742.1 hypothetical protein [Clostridium tarantellae]